MEIENLDRFGTLAHPQRMAALRLLVRRYPDAVPAGEIADALGQKANTMSVYLSALQQVGLVEQERHGTSRRYRVRLESLREMTDFLFLDCCRGRPELCPPDLARSPRTGEAPMPGRRFNVLFICTGNSARSIFAESILRREGGDRFDAWSAGTRPYSELNPTAVQVLRDKGHDTAPLRAKNIAEFQTPDAPVLDFVFTVCDRAANEECPAWPGRPVTAHWGMPDPVRATGTEAERRLAFQQVYGALRNRILGFAALPLETLDRVALQAAVDDLARTEMPA